MDKKKLTFILVLAPVILLALLNLLTVFTPELGFDSLWYHLTLPKLWLLKHQWFFNGGLLYYSVMPRLTETIYIPLIKYLGFIGPKLFQYLSSLGTCFVIWKIGSKINLSKTAKTLAVSFFYCTWLVSWQSGSSYIDPFRTFLESLALLFLISDSWKLGGLFLGLSVGTKWLSLGSVAIYSLVFGPSLLGPALLLITPWFFLAYKYTGNPLYPLFDPILHNSFTSPWNMIIRLLFLPLTFTLPFDDFLSPMVFVLIIFSALSLFDNHKKVRQIALVGLLGSIFCAIIEPPSTRYFLPFFPAIIISALTVFDKLKPILQKIFITLTVLSSIAIIILRFIADIKYLPYLTGQQSTTEFLTSLSDRLPDTFIDSDDYVVKNVPQDSKILIDKLHNLFYFPYNFDHTSWSDPKIQYDYLITRDTLPKEIKGELIHVNSIGIQIYKLTK